MKEKTYSELEEEVVDGRKKEKLLRERSSKWKDRALEAKRFQKSLILQYERVIKELRNTISTYEQEAPRIFILWLITKIRGFKEGGVKKNG